MTTGLSKAERLRIGSQAAPVLRRRASGHRRVNIIDDSGNVVRVSDDVEIANGLLSRAGIEFSVEQGSTSTIAACGGCGVPVMRDKGVKDSSPPRCANCRPPTLADALRYREREYQPCSPAKRDTVTGRPSKADEDRKDDIIRIRVTAEQKAMFSAAAERAGYDVSVWLRGLGVREAGSVK